MPRYLVVDDSPTSRAHLRAALAAASPGAQVAEAEDATQALHVFGTQPFDAVFLDMVMAGENGLDVLRHLRGVAPQVPVVLVTGLPPSHPDVQAAMRGGIAWSIGKPVNVTKVLRALEAASAPPEP